MSETEQRCKGITKTGEQCTRIQKGSEYCYQHQPIPDGISIRSKLFSKEIYSLVCMTIIALFAALQICNIYFFPNVKTLTSVFLGLVFGTSPALIFFALAWLLDKRKAGFMIQMSVWFLLGVLATVCAICFIYFGASSESFSLLIWAIQSSLLAVSSFLFTGITVAVFVMENSQRSRMELIEFGREGEKHLWEAIIENTNTNVENLKSFKELLSHQLKSTGAIRTGDEPPTTTPLDPSTKSGS